MSLNVVSHYPTINSKDVARNSVIRVTFDKPFLINSVNSLNFSIQRVSDYQSVDGIFSYEINASNQATTIIFTPNENFLSNTLYSVFLFKKPNSIVSKDGDQIDITYNWSFETGNELLNNPELTGTQLTLVRSIYNDVNNELTLKFNLPVDYLDVNGSIFLSTSSGGNPARLIDVPISNNISKNDVLISLTENDKNIIQSWPNVSDNLKIKIEPNVFSSSNRFNTIINYTDVDYLISGIYVPPPDPSGLEIPEVSGSINFNIYKTFPKNEFPNMSGTIPRIKIWFTGLPINSPVLYKFVEVAEESVI